MKDLYKICENFEGFFSWLYIQINATSDSPDILVAVVLNQATIVYLRFEILEKIRLFKSVSSSTHKYAEVAST